VARAGAAIRAVAQKGSSELLTDEMEGDDWLKRSHSHFREAMVLFSSCRTSLDQWLQLEEVLSCMPCTFALRGVLVCNDPQHDCASIDGDLRLSRLVIIIAESTGDRTA